MDAKDFMDSRHVRTEDMRRLVEMESWPAIVTNVIWSWMARALDTRALEAWSQAGYGGLVSETKLWQGYRLQASETKLFSKLGSDTRVVL